MWRYVFKLTDSMPPIARPWATAPAASPGESFELGDVEHASLTRRPSTRRLLSVAFRDTLPWACVILLTIFATAWVRVGWTALNKAGAFYHIALLLAWAPPALAWEGWLEFALRRVSRRARSRVCLACGHPRDLARPETAGLCSECGARYTTPALSPPPSAPPSPSRTPRTP
jgi:hypothetical protein